MMSGQFDQTRIALSTGVELDVVLAGNRTDPPVILLHGFPESHRTWRGIIPDLARDHFVIAPDQRGYARSSKPEGVENYTPDKIVGDLIALADHLEIDRFTLVGHDWGGAVAWMAALGQADRVERLIIINAPHPFLFQKALFDDAEQRRASQYIRAFRDTSIDKGLTGAGIERFFDNTFVKHATAALLGEEKAVYLDQWSQPGAMTAMLNWYRASSVTVPEVGENAARPAFLDAPFPETRMPVLVIWGMKDSALLPVLIDTLDEYVPDLTVTKIQAGHFVTWEKPVEVVEAIRDWTGHLASTPS